jgi:hypothetical protein
VDFIENVNSDWINIEADATSAIASGIESIANIFISSTAGKRDADLQARIASRDYQSEADRLRREAEFQQQEVRQGFAIGAIQELRKADKKKTVLNIAIVLAIFGVLAIGIYYAGKK